MPTYRILSDKKGAQIIMQLLPPEMAMAVVSHMHPHEAMKMQRVSRQFKFVSSDPLFAVAHLQQAASTGLDEDSVEFSCLNRNYAIAYFVSFGFTKSVEQNSTSVVSWLVKSALRHPFSNLFDSSLDDHRILQWASTHGHASILNLVASHPKSNPGVDDDVCIRNAAKLGHTECVKILLRYELVNPGACDNFAIRLAAHRGHTEVVRALLCSEKVDPAARSNWALKSSSNKGYKEIVRLLLESGKVDPTAQMVEQGEGFLRDPYATNSIDEDDDDHLISCTSIISLYWQQLRRVIGRYFLKNT
ncbi:hypothetical protein BJ741DRAFT_652594 [Chytriomyces cf. hyalinus JEL632]|nr:hypothetical protein BJ741DRAFT_652594 [Chytriomyces cf. hyalinus JEL632]